MLERGEWRAKVPGAVSAESRLPHQHAVQPALRMGQDRAGLAARVRDRADAGLRNTFEGLPYEEKGESVDEHFLRRRAITFPSTRTASCRSRAASVCSPPASTSRATGSTCDLGMGKGRALVGLPVGAAQRRSVAAGRMAPARRAAHDGVPACRRRALSIAAAAIDAGYLTDRVWTFCQARTGRNVFATVGRDGRGRKLIEAPGPDRLQEIEGQKAPDAYRRRDTGKDLLDRRLKLKIDEQNADAAWVHRILEHDRHGVLRAAHRGGDQDQVRAQAPGRVWQLKAGRRNEALDTAILNMAALQYLGPKVIANLETYATQISELADRREADGGEEARLDRAVEGSQLMLRIPNYFRELARDTELVGRDSQVWMLALESLDFYEYRDLRPEDLAGEPSRRRSRRRLFCVRCIASSRADISSGPTTMDRTESGATESRCAAFTRARPIPQMQLCLRLESKGCRVPPVAGPRHCAGRTIRFRHRASHVELLHAERRFFRFRSLRLARTYQQQLDANDALIAQIEAAGVNQSINVLGRVFTKRNLDELYKERARLTPSCRTRRPPAALAK
jgi:hypothetical protein